MEATITLQKIQDNFENDVIEVNSRFQQDTAVIAPSALLHVATFLKEDPELQYNTLMDLTAVDYLGQTPRFEVVYHLFATGTNQRIRIKVRVAEEAAEIASVVALYASANWMEREVFDLYGIRFDGHPDLRRILLYDEFEGHPLRKDYPKERRQPLVGPRN